MGGLTHFRDTSVRRGASPFPSTGDEQKERATGLCAKLVAVLIF
jgi:hypothetical protein